MDENRIILNQSEPVSYNRSENGLFEVSGWAVHTGIFKDGTVQIPETELSNIADTLKSKQLRKDHDFSTDSVVGRIRETKADFDTNVGKEGVRYMGVIRDAKLEQQIEDEFIDNVSIGFELTPECSLCGEDFRRCPHWFDEAHVIARDVICHEQSFVAAGADAESTIEPGAHFGDTEEFTAQFANKLENKIPIIPEEKIETFVGDVKIDDVEVPEVPITISYTTGSTSGTWSTNSLANNDKNGDEMEKTLEVQLQEALDAFEDAKAEAIKTQDALNALQVKADEGDPDKDAEFAAMQANVTALQASEKARSDKEDLEAEIAKKELCKEIADEELVRGSLSQENYDSRLAVLEGKDVGALEFVMESITAIPKPAQEGEPAKIGKFHADAGSQGIRDKMGIHEINKEDFDMKDKKLQRFMFGKMLNYPQNMLKKFFDDARNKE